MANHLSRIPTAPKPCPINDKFPDEQLLAAQPTFPYYADTVNYLATGDFPTELTIHKKNKVKSDSKYYVWDEPYL